jgi:hypothetical protein
MKKHKLPKTYKKEDYRIPLCEKCGEELVKFRGKWVCKDCMKLKIQALPGWEPEEVSFGAIYSNREHRRRK